jgi:hypothetical protein
MFVARLARTIVTIRNDISSMNLTHKCNIYILVLIYQPADLINS